LPAGSDPTDQDSCDDTDPRGCWIRGIFEFPELSDSGVEVQPTDATSWAGYLKGDPVRIVK